MLKDIEVLCHSSIKINKEKVIYIDPYKIKDIAKDADLIFITHGHYDHYSEEDIDKIKKSDTIIVAPKDLLEKLLKYGFKESSILCVEPNKKYNINGISFETVPAYNINKQFHPTENQWVGYILELDGNRYYIAGDTDVTEDNEKVRCDVAFVPVGGTYTMNAEEAANLANKINPKIAVPIHYGSIVGTIQDAEKFVNLLNSNIKGKIFIL